MYTGMLHTHKLVVTLFLLHYLIKFALLMLNKNESLLAYSRKTKVAEMIISTLFLLTGVFLALKSGSMGQWFWAKIIAVVLSIPLAIVAYKKQNKAFALMSMILLIYAYGVSESKTTFIGEQKKMDTSVTDGKIIYENNCKNCHGDDGKMGLSGAKDLTQSTLSIEDKKLIVLNGKNAMPKYKDQLTDEQVNAVVSYVESLKK